jgi:hypothetical protein
MRFITAIPLLGLVVILYNLVFFPGLEEGFVIFSAEMPSGGIFSLSAGNAFVILGLVALFFEMMKAARVRAGTVLDHMFSTAVFIVALIEFLLVPYCSTASFFILMCMALADVVAGFTISIFSARRDLSLGSSEGGL